MNVLADKLASKEAGKVLYSTRLLLALGSFWSSAQRSGLNFERYPEPIRYVEISKSITVKTHEPH